MLPDRFLVPSENHLVDTALENEPLKERNQLIQDSEHILHYFLDKELDSLKLRNFYRIVKAVRMYNKNTVARRSYESSLENVESFLHQFEFENYRSVSEYSDGMNFIGEYNV